MRRLFVVRDAVPGAAASAEVGAANASAVYDLVNTASDTDFTIADLLGDLFAVATTILGVVGAKVALTDGTCLDFGVTQSDGPDEQHAVAALPLHASGRGWGMVYFHRPADRGWSVADLTLARTFSQVAASSIAVARIREQAKSVASERARHRADTEQAGVPNCADLLDRVDHELFASARRQHDVGMLVLDIDGFSRINARIGGQRGDLLLADLMRRVGATLTTSETLTPMAGDAFAVICGDLTGSPSQVDRQLRELGRRIQHVVWAATAAEAGAGVSLSIGAAVAAEGRGPADLLGDACAAMIAAKGRGRGQIVVSEPAVVPLAERRAARNRSSGAG
jgi:diguanylate cyclase (GGDEF)-like protein